MSWKPRTILGVIVSVGVGLGGYATFASRVHRSRPNIEASVTYGPIVETPAVARILAAVKLARSGGWMVTASKAALARESTGRGAPALSTHDGQKAKKDLLTAVNQSLRDILPSPMFVRAFGPHFYQRIVIQNAGSEAANGVQLSVPHADDILVATSGGPGYQPARTARVVKGSRLMIGTMEPLDRITVTALMDLPVTPLNADKVSVVYTNGVGHVSVLTPYKQTGANPWVSVVLLLIVAVCLSVVLLFLMVSYLTKQGYSFYQVKPGYKLISVKDDKR